ncbi:MAG: ABC transporter ATP-binding protein [Lentisphaeraceae bacterium]|nr:ABC transporter ATP-binding protein [Lentisphaeraceae bacterium]
MKKLIVNQISKSFENKNVLTNVTFSVDSGELFCLLGGNGAGKSTMIKLLLGFQTPDKGNMRFDKWDLSSESELVRKEIFYLPEQVNFYPELSAIENLNYLSCLSNLNIDQKSIRQALEEVGLSSIDHNLHLTDFSKGMRQKVALAFAKLKKSRLLLLDEPTSGLDPSSTREFVSLIESLKKDGACAVLVTHDLRCAHMLADGLGILKDGILHNSLTKNDLSLGELEKSYFDSVLK